MTDEVDMTWENKCKQELIKSVAASTAKTGLMWSDKYQDDPIRFYIRGVDEEIFECTTYEQAVTFTTGYNIGWLRFYNVVKDIVGEKAVGGDDAQAVAQPLT